MKAKHFRVLTWQPKKEYSDGAVKALADHTFLSPETFRGNMDYAWRKWKGLEKTNPFVEVYGYSSVPTAQAICNDDYLQLELLPFNRPKSQGYHECGVTDHRPALLISARQKSYWTMREWFEDLWVNSMLNTPERLVAEHWRKPRLDLLRKRGLLLKN